MELKVVWCTGKGFRDPAAHPHQEFSEYPPGGVIALIVFIFSVITLMWLPSSGI